MVDLTFDMEPQFRELYEKCRSETMTSIERMYALWSAVRHVADAAVAGDIVECGVWRGGSMMLVAHTLLAKRDSARQLWLYDTFDGMPAPTGSDVQAISGRPAGDVLAEETKDEENPFWAVARRDLVERNMRATDYPHERLRFVEGKVEETIPASMPEKISILRLDTDWYESTRHELEHLWPRLEKGGVLIIDDYGYWEGARRAVDEFFSALHDAPLLSRIDFTGRIAVKR